MDVTRLLSELASEHTIGKDASSPNVALIRSGVQLKTFSENSTIRYTTLLENIFVTFATCTNIHGSLVLYP